jgi:predicted ATPase
MARIRIKNFGPVKDGFTASPDGFFDISKVTLFIGGQGTGKSTVAKLVSTFLWLEKRIVQGMLKPEDVSEKAFIEKYIAYHLINNYMQKNTEIIFSDDVFEFCYHAGSMTVKAKREGLYRRPKIIYIPAERNFCAALTNPNQVSGLPYNLAEMLAEYDNAKNDLAGKPFKLPVADLNFRYDSVSDKSYISDISNTFQVELYESSSGIQSVTPLSLITQFLADSIDRPFDPKRQFFTLNQIKQIRGSCQKISTNISPVLKNGISFETYNSAPVWLTSALQAAGISLPVVKKSQNVPGREMEVLHKLEDASAPFINSRFINIVEEPEQNLFPVSQKAVLYQLLDCAGRNKRNALILTTHSPYILESLNNCIYAAALTGKGKEVSDLVPWNVQMPYSDVAAYKIKDGIISSIKDDDMQQIDPAELDSCSNEISDVYSKLADREYDKE